MSQDAVDEYQDPNYQKELLAKNLELIYAMSTFTYDWDRLGAEPFTQKEISFFESVVKSLYRQPDMYPKNHSLVLHYEGVDDSTLSFFVYLQKTSELCFKKGWPMEVIEKDFTEDVINEMNDEIKRFDEERTLRKVTPMEVSDKLPFD